MWNSTQRAGFYINAPQNWAGFWGGGQSQERSTPRDTQELCSMHRTQHRKGSYLKSLPILLPLSGIPGSGHKLCPWDTPTWVTTKQKNKHIQRQNSKGNILSAAVLVDVARKMATGSSETSRCSVWFQKNNKYSAQFTHPKCGNYSSLGNAS